MGVSCIYPVALADAKGTMIIRRTCFDRQLAVQYKEMVRDLAMGVPRNDLAGRKREEARLNVLPSRNGLDTLDGVVGSFLLLFRVHGGLVYLVDLNAQVSESGGTLARLARPQRASLRLLWGKLRVTPDRLLLAG